MVWYGMVMVWCNLYLDAFCNYTTSNVKIKILILGQVLSLTSQCHNEVNRYMQNSMKTYAHIQY